MPPPPAEETSNLLAEKRNPGRVHLHVWKQVLCCEQRALTAVLWCLDAPDLVTASQTSQCELWPRSQALAASCGKQ
jgi:hypothetical protein